MSIIKAVGFIASAAIIATAAYGCSGSTTTNGGNGTDGGGGGGGGDGSTTPVTDAGGGGSPDSSTTKDSGTGPKGDGGLACPPSTATFTPRGSGTPVPNQQVCGTQQIADFVTACGDQGTQAACNTWMAANMAGDAGAGTACGNCIMAPKNNGGVFTDVTGGYFAPNYGACLELLDKTNGAACATAYNNVTDCEGIACDSCTKGVGACVNAADQGSCASYLSAANTACAADNADGGTFATCAPDPQGQNGDYTFIISLICGGGDAGVVDAGHD